MFAEGDVAADPDGSIFLLYVYSPVHAQRRALTGAIGGLDMSFIEQPLGQTGVEAAGV